MLTGLFILAILVVAAAVYFRTRKTTVDEIISDIDSKVTQLGVVADAHAADAAVHQEVIDKTTELKTFAEKEKARAVSIAEKFKALISVP